MPDEKRTRGGIDKIITMLKPLPGNLEDQLHYQILGIAFAITLGFNTSQISSIYSVTAP